MGLHVGHRNGNFPLRCFFCAALRSLGQWFGPAARANPNVGSSGCLLRRRLRRTDVRLQVETAALGVNKFPRGLQFPPAVASLARSPPPPPASDNSPSLGCVGLPSTRYASMHLRLTRLSPTIWVGVAPIKSVAPVVSVASVASVVSPRPKRFRKKSGRLEAREKSETFSRSKSAKHPI